MRTRYNSGGFHNAPESSEVLNVKKKLIDKVTKLFALADDDGATPGEALAARNMAVSLLAKHNITISEISDKEEYRQFVECFNTRPFNHTKILYHAIARFTGVFFLLGSSYKRFHYIGSRSNLEAFRYMLSIVIEQQERDFQQWKQSATSFQKKLNSMTTNQQWRLGFAHGVSEKCDSLMEQTIEAVEERGLVPVNEAKQSENWYNEMFGRTETALMECTQYSKAGYESGQSVNLNKGVGSQSSTKQIGV